MEIVILPDNEAIGSLAADAIGNLLQRKPDAVLGLATGSSPLAIYDELAARCAAGTVTFAQASGFTLDEYVGLPADHPESYRNVIDKDFVSRVDFAPGAVQGPDGLAEDIPAACAAYEAAIAAAGGVDLQILGIGTDGHIGFNEPGSSLASRTRIKTLTRQTRIDNARFFGGDLDAVPTHCLTQGLATIMSARHVVLVATGPGKAEAVHHLVEGPVSALWPATILQHHPHVDGAAGRRRREPAAAGRLLPRDLPGQAGLAGHLSLRRVPIHRSANPPPSPRESSMLITADTVVTGRELLRPGWIDVDRGRGAGGGRGRPAAPGRPRAGRGHRGARVRGHARARRRRRGVPDGRPVADDGATATAVDLHRRHGTTTMIASLVTAHPAELLAQVRVMAEQVQSGLVAGIHLEGPWLAAERCGAHELSALRDPDPAELDRVLAAGGGTHPDGHPGPGTDRWAGGDPADRGRRRGGRGRAHRGHLRPGPGGRRRGCDRRHPPVQRDAAGAPPRARSRCSR